MRWLVLPTLALAAGSAVLMPMLYHPGYDPARVYEGSDTRACGLLVGAALAMVWPSRQAAGAARWTRRVLDVAGVAGLAVIGLMIWRVGQYSSFTYQAGLVVLSVATAGVLAAAACPGSLVGAALGWRPLRWIGVRSYGIYLWHFPVIVLTTPANATEDLPRAAVQIAASIGLAALSWRFVEEPIRHGALGRVWKRLRTREAWRAQPATLGSWAAATGCVAVVALAGAGLSGAVPVPSSNGPTGTLAAGSLLPPPPPNSGGGTGSAGPSGADTRGAGKHGQGSDNSKKAGTGATRLGPVGELAQPRRPARCAPRAARSSTSATPRRRA